MAKAKAKAKSYRSEHKAVAALTRLGYTYSGHLTDWPSWALRNAPGKRGYPKLSRKLIDLIITECQQTCWRDAKGNSALIVEGAKQSGWFIELLDEPETIKAIGK